MHPTPPAPIQPTAVPLFVYLLSGDLMFASKVRTTVQRLGGRFAIGGGLPDSEETASITHVVLDLASCGGLAETLADTCRQKCPQARTVAFGPHVHADRLQAARAAGIETVVSNGQFAAAMPSFFQTDE